MEADGREYHVYRSLPSDTLTLSDVSQATTFLVHENGPPASDRKGRAPVPTTPETKPKPAPEDPKPSVTETYNGVDVELPYNPNATVNSLLEHALNEFGVRDNRHTMALATT